MFSVTVFYDERVVIVAEQRPDASEEDSFQWMSRVLQVNSATAFEWKPPFSVSTIFSLWSYRKIIRHIEHYPAKLISVLGFICRLLIASTKWGSTAWLWSRRTPYQKRRWVASTFLTQSSFS